MAHKTPVRRKGGRSGLPQVSGCHVVRGRQSSPVLEVRPGNTVNIQVKLGGSSPGQDRRLPDMVALQTLADDQHSIWEGKKQNIDSTWDENTRLAKTLWIIPKVCSNSRIFERLQKISPTTKATQKPVVETTFSWSHDMEGHVKKCVERNCELTNRTT